MRNSHSQYLNSVSVNVDLEDSRGKKLSIGDYVITPGGTIYQIVVMKSIFGDIMDVNRRDIPRYIIHIPKSEFLNFDNFINKSGLSEKQLNSCFSSGRNYTNVSTLFYDMIKSNYSNKKGSLRGFPIHDYIGRDLSVGDLVIYTNKDYRYKYGIIISDTQVFNEDNLIERVHFVFKINSFTDLEKDIYEKLSYSYKENSINKVKMNTYSIGDVYNSGSHYYVYLGHIYILMEQLRKSNSLFNVQFDSGKNYWIKLKGNPDNFKLFRQYFLNSLEKNYIVNEHKIDITDNLYSIYYSVDGFKNIVTSIPKNTTFNSHIEITDDIVYQNTFDRYLSGFILSFRFN